MEPDVTMLAHLLAPLDMVLFTDGAGPGMGVG